jgi:two-component system chemotaxis sensor kinase CheA
MIDDEELRQLYKTASQEHLQKLETGILQLEKNPDDKSPLPELLREAHSLKGDSRMLGVGDVETLTHQIEHILGGIDRGETQLTAELSDRIYQSLDAIAKLVTEAVTGQASNVDTFAVLAQLMGATPPEKASEQPPSPTPEPPTSAPVEKAIAQPSPVSVAAPAHNGKTATATTVAPPEAPYRIETLRVETRYLDDLMTQTGELTVTKTRIAHVCAEVDELANLWEEWQTAIKRNHGNEENHPHLERIGSLLHRLRGTTQENASRLDAIASHLEERIQTLRLLPLSTIFNLFPRLVRDLAKHEDKQVELKIEGGETTADKRILEEMKDPLMHLIRNAIDHGIETPAERLASGKPECATIRLSGRQTANNVIIEISDDGRGLDLEKIKKTAIAKKLYRPDEVAIMTANQIYGLIFTPGFSTQTTITEVSGRGVGLDVVHTNVERLKGTIQVTSTPGQGSTFRIQLGTTLATANVLLVEVQKIAYAIPIEFVQTTFFISQEDIFTIEGRETIAMNGQAISIARLANVLELSSSSALSLDVTSDRAYIPCILLQLGEERLGLCVDDLIDTQDVVLKPQSQLIKRARNVAGATILGTGEVCMILNPVDLIKSVQKSHRAVTKTNIVSTPTRKQTILLVEDSIAIRTQEKRILEGAGYEVVTAVDGLDGFNKLSTRAFDAIVSDIQMPNLDGLALTARIRQQQEYNELPIILVTSLASDADKKRGAEAGANAYITKDAFNQEVLLETLQRLV